VNTLLFGRLNPWLNNKRHTTAHSLGITIKEEKMLYAQSFLEFSKVETMRQGFWQILPMFFRFNDERKNIGVNAKIVYMFPP